MIKVYFLDIHSHSWLKYSDLFINLTWVRVEQHFMVSETCTQAESGKDN